MVKRSVAAFVICAVMVIIALSPLVVGDTHEITKGEGGPSSSSVSWVFSPPSLGRCSWHIVNSGLRSLILDVYDVTIGMQDEIMHQKIRFATFDAFPTGEADTMQVVMSPTHTYLITATPSGPRGSYCSVTDVFMPFLAPVASFGVIIDHLTVTVVDAGSSDPDGQIVSWQWTFGDGGVGTGIVETHTYAAPGDYPVKLTVTDNDGLTGIMSETVSIIDIKPIASFTYTKNGFTVNVDASESWDDYGITGYMWNWGDGTSGTGVTASHTYAVPLNPTVAQDESGKERVPYPFMTFGFVYDTDRVTPIVGASVTITNERSLESGTVLTDAFGYYEVNINDYYYYPSGVLEGDVITATAISEDLSGSIQGVASWVESPNLWMDVVMGEHMVIGQYLIRLTVVDTIGQSDVATQEVALVSWPVASFTVVVSDKTVYVDATSSSDPDGWITGTLFEWGDGSMSSPAVTSHTYTATGYYTITLTVWDNDGLTDQTSQTVYIADSPPTATFLCIPNGLTVSVTGYGSDDYGIVSYAWDFGDGATGTGKQATHTYASAGTYTITLTVTDTIGQTGTASRTSTLAHLPTASFTYTVSGSTINVDASGSSAEAGIASYTWNWGDGSALETYVTPTASHTYMNPVSSHLVEATPLGVTCRIPIEPDIIYGYTYASDGTILTGCSVTITNTRSGDTVTTVSDSEYGFYEAAFYYDLAGDVIKVTAVKGTLSGTNSGVIDYSGGFVLLWLDVYLSEEPCHVVTLTVTDTLGQTSTMTQLIPGA